jgi:predicted NBD/HSP70 family sugar kinase/putative N-acetylmannosamine-6-phosphate epimerase
MNELLTSLQGKLVVSCQAPDGDVFHGPASMAMFARSAVEGGAAGIRANGPEDVAAIRRAVDVPILAIHKAVHSDGGILITPSFEAAEALAGAGASAIALDCTARGRASGALERLARIRQELRLPVLADIATIEEGIVAAQAGADMLLTTMRGYTADTKHIDRFEPEFVAALKAAVKIPVAAEGRISTPAEAAAAMAAGACFVVVGTAITRPAILTRQFRDAVEAARPARVSHFAGIDLGSTNTKSGIVSSNGELLETATAATPAGGREVLLAHLESIGRDLLSAAALRGLRLRAVGIATGGWVDSRTGRVLYASENLPGWTGAPVGEHLSERLGLPVAVENDANALAIAEKRFGAGRHLTDFVLITLGTGIGGGCYIGGRFHRGAHSFANAVGHIPIEPDGLPCTCGGKGCVEAYANVAALRRYAGERYGNAAEIIAAARSGDATAREAIRTLANYLSVGCAAVVNLLDPEALILGGGVAENNPFLLADLDEALAGRVTASAQRKLVVCNSALGYHGGVLGAVAVAMDFLLVR